MLLDFFEQADVSVDKLSDELLSMSVSLFYVKTPRVKCVSISDKRTVESLLDSEIVLPLSIFDKVESFVNSEIILSLSISDGLEIIRLLHVDVSK